MDLMCSEVYDVDNPSLSSTLNSRSLSMAQSRRMQQVRDHAVDMVKNMEKQQNLYAVDSQYIERVQVQGMEQWWRSSICRWLMEVAKEFEFSNSTVLISMNYIDRFLSIRSTTKQELQLLGLVSMSIASKINETKPITMNEMLQIAKNVFSSSIICNMEILLMTCLNWHLHPPVTFDFLECFLCVLDEDDRSSAAAEVEEYVAFTATSYEFLAFDPLDIAIGILQCVLGNKPLCIYIEKIRYIFQIRYTTQTRLCEEILLRAKANFIISSSHMEPPLRAPSPVSVEEFPHSSDEYSKNFLHPPTKKQRISLV